MTQNTPRERADEFLKMCDQFRLGDLVTEQSHPVTSVLSEVAKDDIAAALDLLFQVDGDVVGKYREWVNSGRAEQISDVVADALRSGGRVFFTGCGATGRLSILLDSIWRAFWKRAASSAQSNPDSPLSALHPPLDYASRTVSIMAGGDFALIKSVEGFEDITAFGRRQIAEHNVGAGDVVFAITEGGETSWVIGTAWEALERGAKVYFVYNNPDDVLCERVQRSREVIVDPRIEKINLTTGPMAITGSTRMQATSIQLCVMLTILETALRKVLGDDSASAVPQAFASALDDMYAMLRSEALRRQLAELVALEESVYRRGGKANYFAGSLGIDVLTDTTERSPTFCVPAFRKVGDDTASESWAFLFLPVDDTREAWRYMLKREPRAVEWSLDEVRDLVGEADAARRYEVVRRISREEIYKFTIGLDGLQHRDSGPGDAAITILTAGDEALAAQLAAAKATGAKTAAVRIGEDAPSVDGADSVVNLPLPHSGFLLNGIARVAAKLLLNALSTCVMVRLGRVMGNYMIYVVPSNLKLIDRATRYVSRLTDVPYEDACRLLFEVIDYIEPRMESGQAYPPVVGMAVIRARQGVSNEEAERRLSSGSA